MTFLPYSDFKKSAEVLDYRRLGKQRVESLQILNVLTKKNTGYSNHPAVKMWDGYIESLKLYTNIIIQEWIDRGYVNNMSFYDVDINKLIHPWWLGNNNFHRAMRSRLIEKYPIFYETKFPEDKNFNDGIFLWPVNETKTFRKI